MRIEVGGYELDFFDCIEVGQGGPEACTLSIDGWFVEGRKFDPSPLAFVDKLLIPMRKITFFKSGYVLAQLDPKNSEVKTISKIHGYMKLKRIEGRTVEFATTAWGEALASYPIP